MPDNKSLFIDLEIDVSGNSDLTNTAEADRIVDKIGADIDPSMKDVYLSKADQLIRKCTNGDGSIDTHKLERSLKRFIAQ